MGWLGRQLLRLRYVRSAVETEADLSRFRRRPRRRLLVGIILVFLGLLLGWPAVTLLGVLAAALQDSWFIAWAAPAIYAVSWLIYLAGFVVGGPEALRYVGDFNRWLARVIVTWLVGPEAVQRCISESSRDRDSTESRPRRSETRPDEPG